MAISYMGALMIERLTGLGRRRLRATRRLIRPALPGGDEAYQAASVSL
jgi:hypothetical protein